MHELLLFALLLSCVACAQSTPDEPAQDRPGSDVQALRGERAAERHRMVEHQVVRRGIRDERVLAALEAVPRHHFVPNGSAHLAYEDGALPIAAGQTISQPYIVALMSESLELAAGETVLEIGTGSGYQAAVLAELTDQVYTIEIVPELAATARATLDRLGYDRVVSRAGDGYAGWPEHAPFDAIVVTAAPDHVPPALLDQLAPGGRLCIPVGDEHGEQELLLWLRHADGRLEQRTIAPVRFVPMTGTAEDGPAGGDP